MDGRLRGLSRRRVVGWLYDKERPDEAVEFGLHVNGDVVGVFKAEHFRRDLAQRGLGSGRCGFSVRLQPEWLAVGENEVWISTNPPYARKQEFIRFSGRDTSEADVQIATPPPPAISPSLREQMLLSKYSDLSVAWRLKSQRHETTFGDVLDSLLTSSGDLLTALVKGIAASSARLALLILDRLIEDGDISAADEVTLEIALGCVHILLASEIARSAQARLERLVKLYPDHFASEAVAMRGRLLSARIAERLGENSKALNLFGDLHVEQPERLDLVVRYIACLMEKDPQDAAELGAAALLAHQSLSAEQRLVTGEACRRGGSPVFARASFLAVTASASPAAPEGYLGLANLRLERGDVEGWAAHVRRYGRLMGLTLNDVSDTRAPAPFGFSDASSHSTATGGKAVVAVVMTAFNSASTLRLSAESVLAQTVSCELWIVDDDSRDGSFDIAQEIARDHPQVRLLRRAKNRGTYSAKNIAINETDAEVLTFHDSDDWMDPMRVECGLELLRRGGACAMSNQIRMTQDGEVIARRSGTYTHASPTSMMFEKKLLAAIGVFDEVRAAGDSEMLMRVRMRYGWDAVSKLNRTLAIALHHSRSLTQSGAAAFDAFRYSEPRLEYAEAWFNWQFQSLLGGEVLRLSGRPFLVPEALRP